MHPRWQKKIQPYFVFTRRERRGIYFLLLIITAMWMIPYFFSTDISKISVVEMEQIYSAEDSIRLHQEQSVSHRPVSGSRPYPDVEKASSGDHFKKSFSPKSLFYFDPNTASASEWKTLGLEEKTIGTLQKYISKGGRIRTPEELSKIYGFPREALSVLKPYIRISAPQNRYVYRGGIQHKTTQSSQVQKDYWKKEIQRFPINQGDSASWESLPGIGPRLASRIIQFRSKLGGFHSVEQVAETYGLPDSTFQKIKPFLLPDALPVGALLDINRMSREELQQHPYISYQTAKVIVAYRNQHGAFQHKEDLLRIALITPELFLKIAPYLKPD